MTVRLQKIAAAVPKCRSLADVGCDHGYIGVSVLASGVCEHVVFIDISSACLQKARENCPESLKERASFVCRDGLGDIGCDCAVIAGMGGLEIISVLSNAKNLPNALVLQPMRNQYDVRKFLCRNYSIITDEKFFDGKYYDLIVAIRSAEGDELSENELFFGKTNLQTPTRDFKDYLFAEQKKLTKILQGCDDREVREKLCKVNDAIASVKEKTL